ncbi:MAG: ATP-binding cassette domain-containing protein [Actinomycetota bacterium]|nr:ATP-binding cassette domain-containing protein [Actinomycetota bacterium]
MTSTSHRAWATPGPCTSGWGSWPADALITRLSGGQQARTALARTLVAGPTFLLMGEPTNHLDLEGITWPVS